MIRWLASAASGSPAAATTSPNRRDVRVEVAIELLVGQLGERLHLEALVAVVHEDGEQSADIRPVDGDRTRWPVSRTVSTRRPRLPQSPTASTQSSSAASRSWQSRWTSWPWPAAPAQGSRCRHCSRSPEQVAVKDQDSHRPNRIGRFALLSCRPMQNPEQTYRLRAPASGREALAKASPTASTSTARRRGDGGRRGDPAARALGVGPGPGTREPARLPPLRPADRPRRQRLPLLRAAPAGARRIDCEPRSSSAVCSPCGADRRRLRRRQTPGRPDHPVRLDPGGDRPGRDVHRLRDHHHRPAATTAPATGHADLQPDAPRLARPTTSRRLRAARRRQFEQQCKQNPGACG